MIQLREDIAWVRGADGRLGPFDGDRLALGIQTAADRAGGGDACLAEAITAAIHLFALEACRNQTIDATEIAELVHASLAMLGRADIALLYEQRFQWTEIRLDEMAAQTGFELGFYRQLDTELHVAANDELELVQLRGLRGCVMRLNGAQRWGTACRLLADDIVGFVRARIEQVRPPAAPVLSVEVTE